MNKKTQEKITKETKIVDLDLPYDIKYNLSKINVETLGELLKLNHADLWHNVCANDGIKKLEKYVQSLGFYFEYLTPVPTYYKIKEELKENGITVLEDIFDSAKVCTTLYKAGIFTLDDLLKYGNKIYTLRGLGYNGRKEIHLKLRELDLILESKNNNEVIKIPTNLENLKISENSEDLDCDAVDIKENVEKLEKETEEISDRLIQKRALLNRYKELLSIKKELLENEKSLDNEIEELNFSFDR